MTASGRRRKTMVGIILTPAVPGANDPLTLIQPSQQENPCPIAG